MKIRHLLIAAFAAALGCTQLVPSRALAQATILPPGQTCFSALAPTSGGPNNTGTGFIGLLGTITGGASYNNGTYGGVVLTGGSGTNATANITVSGGIVTAVAILNPGQAYVVGDILSANAASIGGAGSGFSVPVSSLSINYALAGGSVSFYIPSTLTFKQTWQDSGETILNQNPVPLDANGCATVYGAGIYRQILKDSFGNTVWDKLTASTGPSGIFWAGQAAGTGNAITITDSQFALQDGATIQFLAFATNTGPTTIAVSGGSPIAVVEDTSTGPAALAGGEIAIGSGGSNTPMVTYDAIGAQFHLVNPAPTTSSGGTSSTSGAPQGYVNLVSQASGDVIQTTDVTGSQVFYSPFTGNQIPIWNGSAFRTTTFSELVMALTVAGSPSNTIQDVCVFSNNGVPQLVAGPSWSVVAAGAGNRGSGGGSAQITRLQGIWVNANTITAYSGPSTFSIPANQCTIVGSLYIDAAGGAVTNNLTYAQSRKWGVYNFYNRQRITLIEGDATGSWSYVTNTIRPANNSTANSMTVFAGLPESPYACSYGILAGSFATGINSGGTSGGLVGIGFNSTTAFSGTQGRFAYNNAGASLAAASTTVTGTYAAPPSLGINTVTALENGAGSTVTIWNGTQANMLLTCSWAG